MAAKLLLLYLLAVASLEGVLAGMSASHRLIRRVRWLVDGVGIIAPSISGRRIVARDDSGTETIRGIPDSPIPRYALNILSPISSRT
jgi:hypothetical protein